MYYTVYKITNIITGRIYVGIHQTESLGDKICESRDDMIEMEATIVNQEFVNNKQVRQSVNYERTILESKF